MCHDVDRLFDVIACAQRRLTPKTLSGYLTAIGDPLKHQDALVEFAPILRIDSASDVHYEVPGAGSTTIDWLVRSPGQTDLLLEVKNRGRDLVEGLCRLNAEVADGVNAQPEPVHDHNLLFRSVEKKFVHRSATEAVQAVWIRTDVKQEEAELQSAFHMLDPERIHAAILGDWGDDAYVLANNGAAKQLVIRTLRISESRRFVFRRGIPVE